MFTIGSFRFENTLALSPMAGVSDKPMRQICREAGAGFTYTEMLTAQTQLWTSPKSQQRLSFSDEPSPRIVQIAGTEPQQLAHAAKLAVDLGAHIIDINMGCPAKKVCNKLAGSALMKDEKLVGTILETVVAAINVPVTLKTRIGWNEENKNVLNIAHIAENSGISAIAIHGRTRADKYTGQARYEHIKLVKQAVKIPVLANGDITCPQKAKQVLNETGADGLLIGRAAQGNPWLFSQINNFLSHNELTEQPTIVQIRTTVLQHLTLMYEHYGATVGPRIARKHINWYLKGNFDLLRQQVNREADPAKQYQAMEQFFDQRIEASNNNEVTNT